MSQYHKKTVRPERKEITCRSSYASLRFNTGSSSSTTKLPIEYRSSLRFIDALGDESTRKPLFHLSFNLRSEGPNAPFLTGRPRNASSALGACVNRPCR